MSRPLTTEEAASMLGIASATLRDWKWQRIGPPYIQLNVRCVRYSEADIVKFAADRGVVPMVKAFGNPACDSFITERPHQKAATMQYLPCRLTSPPSDSSAR
jgi:Helix-turn-helix domain